MNEMFKYRIPEKILAKFPDDFWKVFHDELTKIFGDDYTSIVDDDCTDYFDFTDDPLLWYTGTFGWHKAFTTACKKFNLNKVLKYYDKLEWYDSDMFDGEICELLQAKFLYRQESLRSTGREWLTGTSPTVRLQRTYLSKAIRYLCLRIRLL